MKTKKIFALILALTMVLALAACGSSTASPSTSTASTSTSSTASTQAAAPAASEEPITFIIAHVDPEDGPLNQNLLEFEKYAEEKSNGRLDVQVFANGLLGGDREILEGINMGTIQMGNMASSNMTAYGDKFALYELPWIFASFDDAVAAFDGELGQIYNEWMAEYDFMTIGVFTYGFRALSNSVREVHTPDDMKGIKIRVMEVPLYIDTFKALGANPTPMSWNEIYTGLQQGTIEAQDNSPEQTYLAKFYEVQPYYSTINHVLSNGLAVCKKSYMDSLPDDLRQIIIDGMEICCANQRESSVRLEEEYLKMMEDEGVIVTRITDEERALFREAVAPIYDQYRDIVGSDVLDLALSYSNH